MKPRRSFTREQLRRQRTIAMASVLVLMLTCIIALSFGLAAFRG